MERIKFIFLMALFVYAGYWSVTYIHDTAFHYRAMLMPEDEGEEKAVPPVEAKPVVLEGALLPPTGEPRDDEVWDFDIPTFILNARRVSMSEIKTGYYFLPERCIKCHEVEGPGQNFYGNENFNVVQEFTTEDGLVLHSYIEKGEVPTLKYIYKERHLRKVPFDEGAPHEFYMKRGY